MEVWYSSNEGFGVAQWLTCDAAARLPWFDEKNGELLRISATLIKESHPTNEYEQQKLSKCRLYHVHAPSLPSASLVVEGAEMDQPPPISSKEGGR